MGEEDEDNPRNSSSRGSIPSARPPRTSKPQPNDETQRNRRRRPGGAERHRGRNAAESSAPTVGPSSTSTATSNLNPAAADFVPGQVFVAPAPVVAEQAPTSARGRPRGGRRGKQPEKKKGEESENENKTGEGVGGVGTSSSSRQAGQRPRRNENVNLRVQPKIIKESEDLMLRMTEALTKGEYDCSICTDSVFYPCYLLLILRFIDGNPYGRVKSAGPSFIGLVSRNGLRILWEKESYGDVPVVRHQVRLYPMSIAVGVEKSRTRMLTGWLLHIVVPSHV